MVVSNHADARHAVHLVHYPNTPAELDTARYRIAYPKEEDVPVPKEVDRMCQVANKHVPLRKNSKLLKNNSEQVHGNYITQNGVN